TIALLTLFNYPVLEALFALQPGLIVGFLLAAVLYAMQRNQPLLAGILLALTTIKPQMTLLAIFYLLLWSMARWREQRRLAIGFAAILSILLATSLLIWPHWTSSWMHVVLGYHKYATPPLVSELLRPSIGAGAGPVLIVALLIASGVLAWKYRNAEFGSQE